MASFTPTRTHNTRAPQLVQEVEAANLRLLDFLGREFEGGLTVAVKYLPEATAVAALVFPPAVAGLTLATTAVDLLQRSIVLVEQNKAAQGRQAGTGKQKLADVLALSGDAVEVLLTDPDISLALKREGIVMNASTVSTLTDDIVAVLNARTPTNPAVAKAA